MGGTIRISFTEAFKCYLRKKASLRSRADVSLVNTRGTSALVLGLAVMLCRLHINPLYWC